VSDFVREASVVYRGPRYKARPINCPEVLRDLCEKLVLDQSRETFLVVATDVRRVPILVHVASVGTATAALVHPREVFKTALIVGAVSVYVAHNHPSGNVRPSREDTQVTIRLIDAGKVLGVPVTDHIIWSHASDNTYSYRNKRPELFV